VSRYGEATADEINVDTTEVVERQHREASSHPVRVGQKFLCQRAVAVGEVTEPLGERLFEDAPFCRARLGVVLGDMPGDILDTQT
jgi:hypothetical protein